MFDKTTLAQMDCQFETLKQTEVMEISSKGQSSFVSKSESSSKSILII